MSVSHTKISVRCDSAMIEPLMAFCSELPFDVFEETDYGFDAYAPTSAWDEPQRGELVALQATFDFVWEEEILPYVNWNAVWEENFEPVEVDRFCRIRAEFHPVVEGFEHQFVMAPKMAFGTGHHATTRMVISAMRDLDFAGKSVLDYGCGTAILAMLAARMGAAPVWAIDIDPNAEENALENLARNEVAGVNVRVGDLEVLPAEHRFDVVLANINKNVILNAFPTLVGRCAPHATLVLSGFLAGDEADMLAAASSFGFSPRARFQDKDWLCLVVGA